MKRAEEGEEEKKTPAPIVCQTTPIVQVVFPHL